VRARATVTCTGYFDPFWRPSLTSPSPATFPTPYNDLTQAHHLSTVQYLIRALACALLPWRNEIVQTNKPSLEPLKRLCNPSKNSRPCLFSGWSKTTKTLFTTPPQVQLAKPHCKLSESMNKMIHRSGLLFASLAARLPIVSCTLLPGDALACRCATEMTVQ